MQAMNPDLEPVYIASIEENYEINSVALEIEKAGKGKLIVQKYNLSIGAVLGTLGEVMKIVGGILIIISLVGLTGLACILYGTYWYYDFDSSDS